MKDIDDIRKILETDEKILVIPHRKPDGDALGSSLALYHFLKGRGRDVTVVAPSKFPYFLDWMPGAEDVQIYEGNEKKVSQLVQEATYLICVDFNDFGRVDAMEDTLREAPGTKILIDHHLKPENSFDHFFTDDQASATAELVYDFICTLGKGEEEIDKPIALSIYTGILTDTGSFRFDRTSPRVHQIVASMIEKGVRPDKVHQQVYDSFSEDRMRLFGYCLKDKLTILPEYNTAYISLTAEEMRHYNVRSGDTDGLVNYPLALEGIQMAALMKERKPRNDQGPAVKISFRSKDEFSVNKFAREHFNGGGHQNAAGGICYKNMEQTIKTFVNVLPQYQDLLKKPQNA